MRASYLNNAPFDPHGDRHTDAGTQGLAMANALGWIVRELFHLKISLLIRSPSYVKDNIRIHPTTFSNTRLVIPPSASIDTISLPVLRIEYEHSATSFLATPSVIKRDFKRKFRDPISMYGWHYAITSAPDIINWNQQPILDLNKSGLLSTNVIKHALMCHPERVKRLRELVQERIPTTVLVDLIMNFSIPAPYFIDMTNRELLTALNDPSHILSQKADLLVAALNAYQVPRVIDVRETIAKSALTGQEWLVSRIGWSEATSERIYSLNSDQVEATLRFPANIQWDYDCRFLFPKYRTL